MMETALVLSLCTWIFLVLARGRFWVSGPQLPPAAPSEFPDVDIIVPARDEAQTIARVVASLRAQQYAGRFRIILVDDNSTDGTAALAGAAPNLQTIHGRAKPPGWSGKLWALQQGVAASSAPLLLFTDADIEHDPRHLESLVAGLEQQRVGMLSEMVRLNCTSLAERSMVPAFVYFFQMLYPFSWVNDARCRTAAAAGGTILIRRALLERCGGIESIKSALIDDVALARIAKRCEPIYLGHSGLAASIRPYAHFSDIWSMISRTAFTQLRHSVVLLAATLVGLSLVWLLPLWGILAVRGWPSACGLAAFSLAAMTYLPTLARYRVSKLWALVLPLIALFYMAATVGSALNHWFGAGARWKSRTYESSEP
ncbi:MAG: glycosyltransferase [Steroidobacteraceae bacterium]|jgi:hopene-associated glycosyltransferase HpnB